MFGTSGVRGPVGEAVTAGTALDVGRALAAAGYERVVVGRDPRTSSRVFADAVSAGLRESGADVIRLGLAATPTVARSVGWQNADAGVSVTGSHNPPTDNGLKLWNPSGQAFDADQRAAIAARVSDRDFSLAPWRDIGGERRWAGADERHVAALVDAVALDGALSAVVDVGNGAGSVTGEALTALGVDVVEMNAQPDGAFPGRPSEPTAETTADLQAYVADADADLGIAHDGDADRMLAVDDEGRFVPPDVLVALLARREVGPGDRVAVPLNTSLVVDDEVAARGGDVVYTPVGDVHVAAAAADPGVVFGAEPSGAWVWPDQTLAPDGSLAACRLAEFVSAEGSLSALVDDVGSYPIHRDSVETAEKEAVMDAVTTAVVSRYEDVQTLDGVRVDLGDAWFLIRPSGTQPLVRVTAEARTPDRAAAVFGEAADLVDGLT